MTDHSKVPRATQSLGLQYWEFWGRQVNWEEGVESIPAELTSCHHWKGSGTDMYTCAWYIWSSSVSTHRTGRYDQNTAFGVIEMEKRPTFFRWCLHLRQPSLDFLCVFRSLNPVACGSRDVVSLAILSTPLDFANRDIGTKGELERINPRCLRTRLPCLLRNPWAGPIRESF